MIFARASAHSCGDISPLSQASFTAASAEVKSSSLGASVFGAPIPGPLRAASFAVYTAV
jgi:hypothetical protein